MNVIQFAKKSLVYSPYRALEYEELQKNTLHGKVLDLGGGKNASYSKMFKGEYAITSLNIDEKIEPTIVTDITKTFPLKDNQFDFAISFNTFEHIPWFETTFAETFRVLKHKGRFIFSTPFLHQVHGSPDDYWRYSATALNNILVKHGFEVEKIIPMGTGLFCARYSLMYGAIPRILRPFFAMSNWIMDKTMSGISKRYKNMCTADKYPLGYFVYARKP